MNFVGLNLEHFSLSKKNSSCGVFAREYARNNSGFGLAQKKWNT